MKPSRLALTTACALAAALTGALMIAVMLGATFSWRVYGLRIRLNDLENALAVGALFTAATLLAGWPQRRMRAIGLSLAATYAVLTLAVIARQTSPFVPVGSLAVFESAMLRAVLGRALIGPSSALGFHQPGPLYLYILAPLYALSGYRTVALTMGAMVVNLASIATVGWMAEREGDDRVAVLLTAASVLWMAVFHETVDNPSRVAALVLPTVALLVVASAAMAGRVRLLTPTVVFASVVGQADVRLLPMALGVAALAVFMSLVRAIREPDAAERRRNWWTFNAAMWVTLAAWMLPLADEVGGISGNLSRLWSAPASVVPGLAAAWGGPIGVVLAGSLAMRWKRTGREGPVRLAPMAVRGAYGVLFGVGLVVGLRDVNLAVAHSANPGDREVTAQRLADEIRNHLNDQHVRKMLIRIDPAATDVAAGVVVALQKAGLPFAVEEGPTQVFGDALSAHGDETESVAIVEGSRGVVAAAGPPPKLWPR